MNRPFGDLFSGTINGKQVTISNCSQYLRLSKQGFKDSDNQETQVLHSDAVDCVALHLLKAAKPALSTHLAAFKLTPEVLSSLPPEIAPTVSKTQETAAKAATSAGESWKSYVPQARVTDSKAGSGIDVAQPGWLIKLTEYGRADFTGAGLQQLLLRADYASTQGTYGNSKLFLLGRNDAQGRVMLVQAVPVP